MLTSSDFNKEIGSEAWSQYGQATAARFHIALPLGMGGGEPGFKAGIAGRPQ
jgi:hypothetical protein